MALQATLVYRLRGCALEAEDLGFVPTTLDMVLARTMTTFATLFGCAAALIQQSFPVRRLFKTHVNVVMAGFARVRTNVFWRSNRLAWYSLLISGTLWSGGGVSGRCFLGEQDY